MERKQDNLLPIGEALAGLDGPVKALAKPRPRRGTTSPKPIR